MLERYFYGGYNASTTIFLAIVINVGASLIQLLAGIMLLPFLWIAGFILKIVVIWGLIAAAKGPLTAGIGSFMCWLFAVIQFCWVALPFVGLFI